MLALCRFNGHFILLNGAKGWWKGLGFTLTKSYFLWLLSGFAHKSTKTIVPLMYNAIKFSDILKSQVVSAAKKLKV